jgi:ribosomal protein L23
VLNIGLKSVIQDNIEVIFMWKVKKVKYWNWKSAANSPLSDMPGE